MISFKAFNFNLQILRLVYISFLMQTIFTLHCLLKTILKIHNRLLLISSIIRLHLFHRPTNNLSSFSITLLDLLLLSLWGRYFFHVDSGHGVPACVSISRFVTRTFANPKSHANSTFVDFLTDSFNVTYAVQTLWPTATSMLHVDYTINGCWSWTLCTIKSEIPSTAAVVTVIDAKSATPEDTQTCVIWHLLEKTFLWK